MYSFIYNVLDGLWIEKVYFLNFLILIIDKKNCRFSFKFVCVSKCCFYNISIYYRYLMLNVFIVIIGKIFCIMNVYWDYFCR